MALEGKPRTEGDSYDVGPVTTGVFAGPVSSLRVYLDAVGITAAFSPDDLKRHVVLRWVDMPATELLSRVAGQLGPGYEVVDRGGVWYVGVPGEGDQVARVFRVAGASGADFADVLRAAGSTGCRVAAVGDAVVVRDTAAHMRAIEDAYRSLMGVRRQWLVEVRFVELSERGAEALGVDWSVAGSVVVDASAAASGLSAWGALASIDLEGLLKAEQSRGDVSLLSISRLHVVEGEDARLQVGDTVPIPRRTVSDSGTVTSAGYDTIDSGILLTVSVRAVSGDAVRLSLVPEISQITGYVDGVPILSRRRIESAAVVQSGGVVVLGGLTDGGSSSDWRGIPGIGLGRQERRADRRRLFVVVRVVDASTNDQ